MKRIAARPEDQPDRRVLVAGAVVGEGFAGSFEQVSDARHRDEVRYPGPTLRKRRPGEPRIGVAHHAGRAIPHAKAAARQPDLAQHRGQRHQHPERLLAVVRTLQRPGHIEHCSLARHPRREIHDHLRAHPGDGARPLCVLGHAVVLPGQVSLESPEPDAIAVEESAIVPPVAVKLVRDPEHHCGVGVGPDGHPLECSAGIEVVAHRAHVHELHARARHRGKAAAHQVFSRTARVDLRVLARHAAECDKQLGMVSHHVPARVLDDQLVHRRDDVRHQHARGAQAIGIGVANVTAQAVQKPMDLALRVVKASSAAPPVGSPEHGAIPVLGNGRSQRTRGQVQRGIPVDFDEWLEAPQFGCRAHAVLKATAAHRRTHDAQTPHRVKHGKADVRRIGIPVEGSESRVSRKPDDLVDTPVRGCIAPQPSPLS